MITIRRDREIHDKQGGWFRARWHFSFDDYQDPENDSFGAMRVFNDDRLVPGAIWPLHPHRDVEGLTYVVEGLFGHEDNVGGAFGPLPAGSVQRMTLGSGAWHSEQNASQTEPMRFIQVWILPDTPSLPPGVEQRVFTVDDRTNRLLQVFAPIGTVRQQPGPALGDPRLSSPDPAASARTPVGVHQAASAYVARLEPGTSVRHELQPGRGAYVYLIDGEAAFDGQAVMSGDAAKVVDQADLEISATATSELILVDVPLSFEPVGIWTGRM
jgi:redox-sensitive bicupin YhaK (pirin superfamily)